MNDDQRALRSRTADRVEHDDHDGLASLVREFIQMMKMGNIRRLDLEHGDLRLSLRAHENAPTAVSVAPRPDGTSATSLPAAVDESADEDLHVVAAPMIGTFYAAPAPNEPPFVQQGDHVEEGQTIGIIEAMKIMNEIAADRAGIVVEIVAKNAQTVEYGSPLIRIQPEH